VISVTHKPVRLGDGKVLLNQLQGGCCAGVADRAAVASAPGGVLDAGLRMSQATPFRFHRQSEFQRQFGMHPRSTTRAAEIGVVRAIYFSNIHSPGAGRRRPTNQS